MPPMMLLPPDGSCGCAVCQAALSRWGTVASEEKCDDPKYAGMTPTHTMCLPVDPSSEEVVLTQEDKDAIVNRHNELRASVNPAATNMQKMVTRYGLIFLGFFLVFFFFLFAFLLALM